MGRLVSAALRGAGFESVHDCDQTPRLGEKASPGCVVVDFSHPSATPDLVAVAESHGAGLVVGTTGQSEAELAALRAVSKRVPVVLARNFSLGIQRLMQLLPKWGILIDDGFEVEVLEMHHRGKRDAPSGTALALLEALFGAEGPTRVHGRHGPDVQRESEVGVHSLRLGGVPGDHALLFGSEHEVIEIRHRALDRAAFVSGVVPAVRFVQRQPAGWYSMLDVMRDATVEAR
jgi:4-hydroxy-tetrahydrodipicolinate reductase